jgi:hypothetical protein
MSKRFSLVFLAVLLLFSSASSQTGEVTISVKEPFFDAMLDAMFKNLKEPDFQLSKNAAGSKPGIVNAAYSTKPECNQYVRLLRENKGVKTAVKFSEGKIKAPVAFTGTYEVPLVGCVDFDGWADTIIDLEFDSGKQVLFGRVRVQNVQLGSVANLAGGLIARYIQGSIDKKVNPVELFKTDKLGFVVPIQNSGGALKLKANGMRYEIGDGFLTLHINFDILKAE